MVKEGVLEKGLEKFYSLSEEKQELIVGAAKKEFSSAGYRLASTNRITKEAGISKGSLFYYFGSKEQLYFHLIKKANEGLMGRLKPLFSSMSPDLVERLRSVAEAYLDLYLEDQETYVFLMTMADRENRELVEKYMIQSQDESNRSMALIFQGIDTEPLRFGMEDVVRVITWTLTGLKEQLFSGRETPFEAGEFKENFMKDFNVLLDVIASGIYKERSL